MLFICFLYPFLYAFYMLFYIFYFLSNNNIGNLYRFIMKTKLNTGFKTKHLSLKGAGKAMHFLKSRTFKGSQKGGHFLWSTRPIKIYFHKHMYGIKAISPSRDLEDSKTLDISYFYNKPILKIKNYGKYLIFTFIKINNEEIPLSIYIKSREGLLDVITDYNYDVMEIDKDLLNKLYANQIEDKKNNHKYVVRVVVLKIDDKIKEMTPEEAINTLKGKHFNTNNKKNKNTKGKRGNRANENKGNKTSTHINNKKNSTSSHSIEQYFIYLQTYQKQSFIERKLESYYLINESKKKTKKGPGFFESIYESIKRSTGGKKANPHTHSNANAAKIVAATLRQGITPKPPSPPSQHPPSQPSQHQQSHQSQPSQPSSLL
jgi:hypothetical protein